MTIQADILLATPYTDTDTIDKMILIAFDEITRILKTTKVEGDDTQLDHIARSYAIHLLNRKRLEQAAMNDPTIEVPEMLPKEIEAQIRAQVVAEDSTPASIEVWNNEPPSHHSYSKSWTL